MVTCGYVRTQNTRRSRIAAIVLTVKGWIARITIYLFLGVITTVAVPLPRCATVSVRFPVHRWRLRPIRNPSERWGRALPAFAQLCKLTVLE